MAVKNTDYRKAYQENEADANRHMSFVNAAAGVLAIVIWILYAAKIFTIPDYFYKTVCILFPAIALLMFTPLFMVKTELVRKAWYKYFILFSLLIVIIALNITIPKHSLLFWPFSVLIANHYYNPRMGRTIFIVTIIAMLVCLYTGMFFGEFDENLFGGGVVMPDGSVGTVETFAERVKLLDDLRAAGNNRYIKVLVFYFFPRAMIVTLFFMVSNLLNRRTYKLLDKEIRIHDEQEKSKTELGVAKEIQMNTLPEGIVDSREVEIIGELKAAKEVGGDLYDYLTIDENHVAALVGDVSGKGVPAAMFMMKTITSFRDFAAPGKSPSQILREVNAAIFNGNKKSMFVTCFLAILDKRNGKVVYANAGHNPPIIGSNGHFSYLKSSAGLMLGCFKDSFLKDEEITLKPGESISLYTDGITEARNAAGEFYGEERLLDVFNRRAYNCAVELHHSVKEDIRSFVKEAPQSDDITIVTMKYQGDKYSYEEKVFDARKENVSDMLSFIKGFCEKHSFPEDFKNKLTIVGDELLSNIVNHGYENKGGKIYVHLSLDEEENQFVLTVIDGAKAFNQLQVDNPEVGTDPKTQPIGGLGIMIVKKIMTEYAYDRINEKNVLVLKKNLAN